MPVSTSKLKPAVSGLTSNIQEGVVFELLRDMMPSSAETPYLRTSLMQRMRDVWRERYDAMSAYTTEELALIARSNQNNLSDELNTLIGYGDDEATSARVASWSATERSVNCRRMERELRRAGLNVMGETRAADILASDTLSQVLAEAGVTDVSALTPEQRSIYAFESMLRESEFVELVGERHVIDDLAQSIEPSGTDELNENIAAFNRQLNDMKGHASGYFDHDETVGRRVVHARSYMVPLSPLDPDYRDRMCSYDSGAGQMMFASIPLDTSVNEEEATTYEHAMARLDDKVRRWPYDYLGETLDIPVAVSFRSTGDIVQYVGAGHVGQYDGHEARFKATLSTVEDAVGFSDLRFIMVDDANYRQATERAIDAWKAQYEASRTLSDDNERNKFADAVNHQRLLTKGYSVPLIDHLQQIGGVLELRPDRETGQLMVADTEHDLSMRVVEKVPEPNGDADNFHRDRWIGKVRTRNADSFEFNLRDAHTGVAVVGGGNGYNNDVANLSDAEAVDLYDIELRKKQLDFLCGYFDDIELTHLRESGALVYPDVVTSSNRTYRNMLLASPKSGDPYIEIPLDRITTGPVRVRHGSSRADDTYEPVELIRTIKIMVTREDAESFLNRTDVNMAKRTPEEQANIVYDGETGRARRLVDDSGVPFADDDSRAYVSKPSYYDQLRGAIANARYNFEQLLDVDGLISEARAWRTSNDHSGMVSPSPDKDGAISDDFIITARRKLWAFLTADSGKAKPLDKPYLISSAEKADDPAPEFQQDWQDAVDDQTASNEVRFNAEQAHREQYVRDYLDAALDKRIGGFDPSDSRYGHRFNPAAVLAYAGGMNGAMGRQHMIAMLRAIDMDPSELIADGVGEDGSDRDAQAIQNAIDPFREQTAETLAELRVKAQSDDEVERALAEYKIGILDEVKRSASYLSAQDLEDADVAIDDSGLVRYRFKSMRAIQVNAPRDNGRTVDFDSPDQTNAALKNAKEMTGYIGRFHIPERTYAGLLRGKYHYGENKIVAPQTHAFMLAQDAKGSSRIERTRGRTFDVRMASMIRSRVLHDIATTYSSKFKDAEVGDLMSMKSMYSSDETSDTISVDDYDRVHADIEAFERDPELYEAMGNSNYRLMLEDPAKKICDHGPVPMKTRKSQEAVEETMANQAIFPDQYISADVTASVRGAAGFNAMPSDRYHDPYTLAGGQSLAVKTESDAAVFDKHQVPDNAKQTTKNHLNVGAELYHDQPPTFDPEHTTCAIGELDQFKYGENDEWNRVRMGQANAAQELGSDETAHVVMMGGAGFTQNDGVVVSKEWAVMHGIYGSNGEYRALKVGDKISDYHGNKSTIARVVNIADSEDVARDKGASYYNMWNIFKQNVVKKEYPELVDPHDPSKGITMVEHDHCNIDVVMNSVSFVSRLNGGLLRDGLDAKERGETLDLNLPTQETVPDGIFTTGISIHNKLADEHNLDNNSRSGWQLGMSVIDDMPMLMAEMYGDNVNGFMRLRESLNVAVGYDFAADGTIIPGIQNTDGMERNLIQYERVESVSSMTLADAQADFANDHAPDDWPKPVIGADHALNVGAMKTTMKAALSEAGGFLSLPFQLTFPERRAPRSEFTDEELERMGIAPGEDVVIGGGGLPVSSERTRRGETMYAFPVESAPGRAGIEQRGQTVRHDHMREYSTIIDEAIAYENDLNLEAAHRAEAERIRRGIELFRSDPTAEGALDPDAYNTGVYRGLSGVPQGNHAKRDEKKPMTWLEALGAYTAVTDGPDAARAVLKEFGAAKSSYDRLSESFAAPTHAQKRAEMQEIAQNAFTKMSDDVWKKNFTGSSNAIKEYLMRSRIDHAKYTVWTANPDCDIDEVRISPEVADKLGLAEDMAIGGKNEKYVALWRSPVLRSMNLAAFRFRIDPSITGVAVNPAVTTRISGDFDGDHVALYCPKSDEAQEELRRERSFARYLVDDHIEPDGKFTTIVDGVETEIPCYELGIDMGLDAQLGRVFDKEAGRLMDSGYRNACVAWYMYEQTADRIRQQMARLDELEYFAKQEHGGELPTSGVLLDPPEMDKDGRALTTADKRRMLDDKLTYALENRDAVCESAFRHLNEGIKRAQAASAEHGVISFEDDCKLISSMMDATVRPGVKGKPAQIENLMSHMGYIPYEPEAFKTLMEGKTATVDVVRFNDNGNYEKREYHSIRELLADKSLFDMTDAKDHSVVEGSFVRLDKIKAGEAEDFTPEMYRAINDAWERMRFEEDASTSLAMNAKTTVTALVGVLPQCGHESLEGEHELVADVTEPMYQMSLDFKLDGQDALRKIPWVGVWNQLLRRGQLYEELLDPNAFENGTIPNPDELTPCKMARLGADVEEGVQLTPENLKVALKNVYKMCDQKLAESKIDQFVDAMVCDYKKVRDENGNMTVIRGCRSLDDIAALRGSTLGRIAFDSGRHGAAMIGAAKSGAKLYEGDSVKMANGYVREHIGDPIPVPSQAKRYADKDVPMLKGNSAAHDGVPLHAMNTRGFDAACSAMESGQGDVKVAIFADKDFLKKLDQTGMKHLYRAINEAIDPSLKGVPCDEDNFDALSHPRFEAVYVSNANSETEYAATMEAINAADLVVMAGDGSSTSMDQMISFSKNQNGKLRYLSDEKRIGRYDHKAFQSKVAEAQAKADAEAAKKNEKAERVDLDEDARSVRISYDKKASRGVDILARADNAQTAVLDVNLRRVATEEDRENPKVAHVVTSATYRFDRDERLCDVLGEHGAHDRAVKHESWNQGIENGDLTIAFTGSLPEHYLHDPLDTWTHDLNSNDPESLRKFNNKMRYFHGKTVQAQYEMIETKVKTFLEGQIEQMRRHGNESGTITVVTGGARGADYLAFEAANKLKAELRESGSPFQVRTVLELPFDDQRENWDRANVNPKSNYSNSYFTRDKFDAMESAADEVHRPGVSVVSTKDGQRSSMSAAVRKKYYADRDRRMVDEANLVVKMENSARPPKKEPSGAQRTVDYAVSQGKFAIDLDTNKRVGAILKKGDKDITIEVMRRHPNPAHPDEVKAVKSCLKHNPRVTMVDRTGEQEQYPTEVTNISFDESYEDVTARLAADAKQEAERQAAKAAQRAAEAEVEANAKPALHLSDTVSDLPEETQGGEDDLEPVVETPDF